MNTYRYMTSDPMAAQLNAIELANEAAQAVSDDVLIMSSSEAYDFVCEAGGDPREFALTPENDEDRAIIIINKVQDDHSEKLLMHSVNIETCVAFALDLQGGPSDAQKSFLLELGVERRDRLNIN